jgi:hypothetical protein
MVGQLLAGLLPVLVLVFGQDRHEGLRERAFGKQAAQQVGDAEGHDKGVGVGAGAKGAREQTLAQ